MLFDMTGTQCMQKSCEWLKSSQGTKLLSAIYAILTFGVMFTREVNHLKNSCHHFKRWYLVLGFSQSGTWDKGFGAGSLLGSYPRNQEERIEESGTRKEETQK